MVVKNKENAMKRCLELALNGSGLVSPNPLVGALIIRDGEIVAEGWHKKYGDVHAEIDAMNNAIKDGITDFTGMSLVVNLEPCSHFGKQPPCVDAIIENNFAKVFIGMQDPNPLVAGKSIEKLKDAGIDVKVGILEADCKWINRFFCHYIIQGMPYVVLKIAQTIDGCIATKTGESKYITCEESRKRVHLMRSEMDAILVGVNTIIKDNPLLDTRLLDKNKTNNEKQSSKIIIIDTNLRTPHKSKIFKNKEREVIIVYNEELANTNDFEIKDRINRLKDAGANLWESPIKNNQIHLRKAISRLTFDYCFTSLLVEGGSAIFSSFINSDLVNELQIFTSPFIIGDGMRVFSNVETAKLEEIKKYKIVASLNSGTDEQLILINDN